MRVSKLDLVLPIIIAVPGTLAGVFAFKAWGFIGLGLLGLVIGIIALQVDIEKEGAVGHDLTTGLYAQQMVAQDRMTTAERAAHRVEMNALMRPLLIAKVISAALIIIGFGGFYLFQLE
jgi:hypothetical protein